MGLCGNGCGCGCCSAKVGVAVFVEFFASRAMVIIRNHEPTDADLRMFGDVTAHTMKILSSVEAGNP